MKIIGTPLKAFKIFERKGGGSNFPKKKEDVGKIGRVVLKKGGYDLFSY